MLITYLLEDTGIAPPTHSVLAQADALIARGHRVRIVTKGAPVTWRSTRAEWTYVDDFIDYPARDEDFIIGTSWPALAAAHDLGGKRAVHLCHEYEGASPASDEEKEQIDGAYALPMPKLVATRPLAEMCRKFNDDVTWIGHIVDDELYRDRPARAHDLPRVLLDGATQSESGLSDGYGAAAHARWFHQKFDLIRVSPWAPSREEPLDSVQEFHVALTTAERTRLMYSCDVLIAPNHDQEGFGLPASEAMASGVPVILTEIPMYSSWNEKRDYALFAPERNPVELGERLIELLSDEELRERLGRRGREVAEQWRSKHVADRLESFLLERR